MNPNDAVPLNTTELAVERSRLAADRTLMAWIRTSLSMISFGFTIFKFFQYIVESGTMQSRWGGNGPRHMGSVLVILGTLLLVPATLQYRRGRGWGRNPTSISSSACTWHNYHLSQ